MNHAMLLCHHFAPVILKDLQGVGTDDVTGWSNMDLQLSPGIHFQSLALGNESSLHRAKLLWENTQETCGRDINKSISATPHWCQMLSSQQKQIIFRLLLIICPQVKSLCPSERGGMAHWEAEGWCCSCRLSFFHFPFKYVIALNESTLEGRRVCIEAKPETCEQTIHSFIMLISILCIQDFSVMFLNYVLY